MTSFFKLLILGSICFSIQACGGDPDSTDADVIENDSSTKKKTNYQKEDISGDDIVQDTKPDPEGSDYFITLKSGDDSEVSSGVGKGNVRISDIFLCSVEDWKMKILTDEFDPRKMIGNEYPAQIISDDFNSNNCQCVVRELTGTGVTNSVGERLKADGKITCDDGKYTGEFRVQLIQQ